LEPNPCTHHFNGGVALPASLTEEADEHDDEIFHLDATSFGLGMVQQLQVGPLRMEIAGMARSATS
jgi:hypothetical protein